MGYVLGWLTAIGVAIALLWGAIFGVAEFTSYKTAKPGYIGVCQTGGPFEGDAGTCGVSQPGSSRRKLGAFNSLRQYPASQRNFTLSHSPGAEGPPIELTTKDGKRVGVSVRFLLTLDRDKIEEFYKAYGLKEYDGHKVYESEGWTSFFRQELTPIANQALKGLVLSKTAKSLNPAFAAAENLNADFEKLNAEGNLTELQSQAGDRFAAELASTLGGQYFTSVRVASMNVSAPGAVQSKVDEAVAASADATKAVAIARTNKAKADGDAKVRRANADAKLYEDKQQAEGLKAKSRAYRSSPEKAMVDAVEALPDNITTLIFGSNGQPLLNMKR